MKILGYVITACLLVMHNVALAQDQGMEKCYGIAKAGQNDCDQSSVTCDKSVIDGDPNYWMYVPKGICNRIVGGMTMLGSGSTHPGANLPNMPPAPPAVTPAAPVAPTTPAVPAAPTTPTTN